MPLVPSSLSACARIIKKEAQLKHLLRGFGLVFWPKVESDLDTKTVMHLIIDKRPALSENCNHKAAWLSTGPQNEPAVHIRHGDVQQNHACL